MNSIKIKKQSTLDEIAQKKQHEKEMLLKGNKCVRSLKPRTEREIAINNEIWKSRQAALKVNKQTKLEYKELNAQALYSLCETYESWDFSRGANYSTWNNRNLYWMLLNYLREKSRLVKLPRKISLLYLLIKRYRRAEPEITLEAIVAREIAAGKNKKLTVEHLAEALNVMQAPLSLDFYDNYDEA